MDVNVVIPPDLLTTIGKAATGWADANMRALPPTTWYLSLVLKSPEIPKGEFEWTYAVWLDKVTP